MTTRNRSRDANTISGTYHISSSYSSTKTATLFRERCQDVIGDMFNADKTLKAHPLKLTRQSNFGGIHNRQSLLGPYPRTEGNCPIERMNFNPVLPSSQVDSSSWNRLYASTGPLTPKVNLPLFIFELKDIPMMLKHAGDLLHKIKTPSRLSLDKEAAAATLAYQFGWAPLIQDLSKLINFSELVHKRQLELRSANSSKGLKRNMTLFEDSASKTEYQLLTSFFGTAYADVVTTTQHKVWATCRWKLRSGQQFGREPSYKEAFKSALGFSAGQIPITVWKALPWSWLIDWFADISNVMQATYNMIYYTPTQACIMEYRSVRETWPETSLNSPTMQGRVTAGERFYESKNRSVQLKPSVKPVLRVPFLDTFKLSILGSLAILRIHRR